MNISDMRAKHHNVNLSGRGDKDMAQGEAGEQMPNESGIRFSEFIRRL
jgi:hypothetical protein